MITLGAIGVSLVFSILRFAHFAHGDIMSLGAYFALVGVASLQLPMVAVFPFAVLLTGLAGVAIDRLTYYRLRSSGGSPIIMLISSVGVALMLRSLIQIIWGPSNVSYRSGVSRSNQILGINIQPEQILIVAGAALLVVLLHLFLHGTKIGKAMRAMSDNMDLARVTGINTELVIFWMWMLAGALAGAAGIFLGMDTRLNPLMGWHLLLPVFAAAILGGIGNFYGAILGGFTIGIIQELSTLVINSAYKPAVAFAIMVLMLVFRPMGLLGGRR
jgi:branched-chain amino acid transport system permease protein/neutral amino acid transport system permease protein